MAGAVGFAQIELDGDEIYWVESRPAEGGRNVVVQRTPNGGISDVTPSSFNVRTRVHEYGGGAIAILDGTVFFSNFSDQRIYRQGPGSEPAPLTPEGGLRYADGVIDRSRGQMVCVREDHSVSGTEAVNTLSAIDLEAGGPGRVLVTGSDFYPSPRISPDGSRLAWLSWNHPNMPWDGTQLWVGTIGAGGGIEGAHLVAGSGDESICQPEWSPGGVLHFVSDSNGWWNLYRWRDGQVEPLCQREAEFAAPQWSLGVALYGFTSGDGIICGYGSNWTWRLAALETETGKLHDFDIPVSFNPRLGLPRIEWFSVEAVLPR